MQQATVDKYTRVALAWEDAQRDTPGLTVTDYVAATGIARTTIDRAIHWRRRHCIQLSDTSKLEAAITSLRERKATLDKLLDRVIRGMRVVTRQGDVETIDPSLAGVASLVQAILAVQTRTLELEGLYKQVLNVKLEGRINHRHYDLTKLSTDRLIDLRKILIEAATGGLVNSPN